MTIPSLVNLCAQVLVDFAECLESLDDIPDELVFEIMALCQTGEKLMIVDSVTPKEVDSISQHLSEEWKSNAISRWGSEVLDRICAQCAYDPESEQYWKQIFMTGFLQDELDNATETSDWDILERYINVCAEYVFFLKLHKAGANILSHLVGRLPRLNLLDLSRDLDDPKIGLDGAKVVADILRQQQCNLRTLNLRNCVIKDEGCRIIVDAIRSNPSCCPVIFMDFRWNDIGDEGSRAVADLVLQNRQLAVVDMSNNYNTMRGRNALKSVITKVAKEQPGRRLRLICV